MQSVNKRALLIALVSAVVGVVLLQLYVRRLEQDARGGDPVDVVLARKDIPAGSIVTAQHLSEYRVPERYVSGRNVLASDLRHVVGTRVHTTVHANDPLLWTDIARMREDKSLAGLVQPGMVAVSISGHTFDGLLGPGDRVDVVFVTRDLNGLQTDDGTRKRAVTLMQSVLVLAVGSHMDRSAAGGNSVSLLVSPEQAQLLIISKGAGDLQLVLRNPDDLAVREPVSAVTSQDITDPKRRANFVHAHAPAKDATKGESNAQ